MKTGYALRIWFRPWLPIKYYKSQKQYFPTENLPHLEADASLLDISSRGRCSVSQKSRNLGKESLQISGDQFAHGFVLSSSLFMSPTSIHVSHCPVQTLGGCGEIHQSYDSNVNYFGHRAISATATSELLLENSSYELRNAPFNANSVTAEISSFFLNQY